MPLEYDLSRLILPIEVLEHFQVVQILDQDSQITIYLDELNTAPQSCYTYVSKGFTDVRIIQDFPLRGKAVFLHLRKRKWLEQQTGKIITNTYNFHHTGTHLSEEFAAFLKAAYRK